MHIATYNIFVTYLFGHVLSKKGRIHLFMIHYFNANNEKTPYDMSMTLLEMLIDDNALFGAIIIMCIGSDRSTGDSLGPIIGYKLEKLHFNNVYVYGSLKNPIHAANLKNAIDYIHRIHLSPYIIAIDASVGKPEHIGFVTLGNGPIKPGLGVKKELPEVGNLHITGIVNYSDDTDNLLLQTTPLSIIMQLADVITQMLTETFKSNNIINVCLCKLQAPETQYPQYQTSCTSTIPEAYQDS